MHLPYTPVSSARDFFVFALVRKCPVLEKARNLGNVLRPLEYTRIEHLSCSECCWEGVLLSPSCLANSARSLAIWSTLYLGWFTSSTVAYLSSSRALLFLSITSLSNHYIHLLLDYTLLLTTGMIVCLTSLRLSFSCASLCVVAGAGPGAGAGDLGAPRLGPDPCAGGIFSPLLCGETDTAVLTTLCIPSWLKPHESRVLGLSHVAGVRVNLYIGVDRDNKSAGR